MKLSKTNLHILYLSLLICWRAFYLPPELIPTPPTPNIWTNIYKDQETISLQLKRITMASLLEGSSSAALVGWSRGHILSDMEDDDDLFEIDLEAVESRPPPQYNWSHPTAGDVLLANCLLPVTDISRAIPTVSEALSYKTGVNVVMIPEPVPLGQLLRLPFLEAFGLHQKRVKPHWDFVEKNKTLLDAGTESFSGFRGRRRSSFNVDSVSEDIAICGG